jgi:hypothetical protein
MSAKSVALIPMSLILMSATPVKESPAAEMLQKLGALEGRWEGNYSWTGARDAKGPIAAEYTYALVKGSVTEELFADGKPYMTSVYHLDGTDLRVTHFCVQNQPRLKADRIDPAKTSAHFAFVDVTNAGPKSNFVEEITIERPEPDRMRIEFVSKGNGPRAVQTLELKRVG